MTKIELDEIIRKHKMWSLGIGGGVRADLNGSSLRNANLSDAFLSDAILRGANLRGANLSGASLVGADLRDAVLIDANLHGANLSGAILSGAYLDSANLDGANLRGADFSGLVNDPSYYSISWSGHGERGRRLHAVEQNGQLVFSCGRFSGSDDELREYIADGPAELAESRLRALETILALHNGGR